MLNKTLILTHFLKIGTPSVAQNRYAKTQAVHCDNTHIAFDATVFLWADRC